MRAAIGFATGLLLLALAAPPSFAQAQRIYVCRDAAGNTLSSDRPIPECNRQPVREIDRDGITRRETTAPLSSEEKRRRNEEQARLRAEQEAQAERRRADRALLARFRSEADIEAARKDNTDRVRDNAMREAQLLERAQQR
jgi:hypothetical protein